ncbi:uncharacterized protein LOC134244637 [Saccostrea cucullata]|uniref:uncharacterized protein LOC134244637 n=1 Tax=Saccostrea cuccullata TaxID=36930 RepID=UPI002ED3DA23
MIVLRKIASIGTSETQGTTHVDLGSTILNTGLGKKPIPDIDGTNTWVWILVIGVFLIIVFTLVCVLIFIFRRGNQKTLSEGHKEEETIPLKMDRSGERGNCNMEKIPLIEYEEEIQESEGNQEMNDESLLLSANTKTLGKENSFGERSTCETNREQFGEEQGEKTYIHRKSFLDCVVENQDEILCLDETRKSDSSKEDNSKEENSPLDKDVSDKINSNLNHQEDSDRDISVKLDRVGIYLDDYEIWKTEISEKYKELSNEERAVLFLILCSNKNTFILEKTETLTKRELEIIGALDVSKNISYSIQTLRSKGFISIENEKVTFASAGVQDETMFDYLNICWKRSKVCGQEETMFKYMFEDNNWEMLSQYGCFMNRQLLNVSLESSMKYFRSRNYRKGKFVRFLPKDSRKRTLYNSFVGIENTYEEILTRIISELGKDILICDILDDKSLHSTISSRLKIPEEVLQWDLDARSRYLEYLDKGKTPIYRARAMIVGCAGAGKTTLLERLQGKSLEDIQKIKSTVGLDVHNDIFEVLENEGKLEVAVRKCEPAIHIKENIPIDDAEKVEEKRLLSILDFGGQCMYYACHQIYLSKRAFYILVVDMSKTLEEVIDEELCDQKDTMFSKWSHKDYLLFWLKSVNCYCGSKAPVILVATHAEEKSEQEKTEYYQELIKTFPVSSTIKTHLSSDRYFTLSLKKHDGECIKSLYELGRSIVDVVISQKQWGEDIPLDWAIFEKFISEKKEKKLQNLDKLKESFDKLLPLSTQEFKDLLRFYHDIGVILYFAIEEPVRNSPEIVILDIQWFVNSFKYVMTDSKQASFNKVIDAAPTREALDTFTTTGEISGTFLKSIWTATKNQTAVEYKDDMMKYMERLGLMAIEEKSDICFIPSMNRMKVPPHVKSKIYSHPNNSPTLYIRFPVLPVFLFYRLIVLCLKQGWKPLMDGRKCIYIDTALFYHHEHVVLLGVSESYIQLLLYNDDQKHIESIRIAFNKVTREVKKMLSSMTNTFNCDLHYQVGYSCTPTEFGKELDNTFIIEDDLLNYYGKNCPLHALAEDHGVRALRMFTYSSS